MPEGEEMRGEARSRPARPWLQYVEQLALHAGPRAGGAGRDVITRRHAPRQKHADADKGKGEEPDPGSRGTKRRAVTPRERRGNPQSSNPNPVDGKGGGITGLLGDPNAVAAPGGPSTSCIEKRGKSSHRRKRKRKKKKGKGGVEKKLLSR